MRFQTVPSFHKYIILQPVPQYKGYTGDPVELLNKTYQNIKQVYLLQNKL